MDNDAALYVSQQFTAHHLTRAEAEEAANAMVEMVASLDAMSIEEIWEMIERKERPDRLVCGFSRDNTLPLTVLGIWQRILDEHNVSRRNRWILAPRWFIEYLRADAGYMLVARQIMADPPRGISEIGTVLGFDLFQGRGTPMSPDGFDYRVLMIAGDGLDSAIEDEMLRAEAFLYHTTLIKGGAPPENEPVGCGDEPV